jgi:hypothetical protein
MNPVEAVVARMAELDESLADARLDAEGWQREATALRQRAERAEAELLPVDDDPNSDDTWQIATVGERWIIKCAHGHRAEGGEKIIESLQRRVVAAEADADRLAEALCALCMCDEYHADVLCLAHYAHAEAKAQR